MLLDFCEINLELCPSIYLLTPIANRFIYKVTRYCHMILVAFDRDLQSHGSPVAVQIEVIPVVVV